jgi:hypothetical protein
MPEKKKRNFWELISRNRAKIQDSPNSPLRPVAKDVGYRLATYE